MHSNGRMLSQENVIGLLVATFIGYSIFAINTDLSSFGLTSARYPDRWALWRYVIVGLWLILAYFVFLARKKQAYLKSFIHGLIYSGIVSLLLASLWLGSSSRPAILGSAVFYTTIAGLLGLSLKNHVWAGILAGIFIFVQVVLDIVVLGIAGSFRIH